MSGESLGRSTIRPVIPSGSDYSEAAPAEKPAQESTHVVEEEGMLDTAGMSETVLQQQVRARQELKKKMEARRKARGGRRGPVARKRKPAEASTDQATPTHPAIERAASPTSGMDGSDDDYSEPETMVNSGITSSQISIADPRYYEDCIPARIFSPSPQPSSSNEDADSEVSWDKRTVSRKGSGTMMRKFGTWSGKGKYRFAEPMMRTPRMTKSCMSLDVSKSTEELRKEMEREQESARDMALGAAKKAWGSGNS